MDASCRLAVHVRWGGVLGFASWHLLPRVQPAPSRACAACVPSSSGAVGWSPRTLGPTLLPEPPATHPHLALPPPPVPAQLRGVRGPARQHARHLCRHDGAGAGAARPGVHPRLSEHLVRGHGSGLAGGSGVLAGVAAGAAGPGGGRGAAGCPLARRPIEGQLRRSLPDSAPPPLQGLPHAERLLAGGGARAGMRGGVGTLLEAARPPLQAGTWRCSPRPHVPRPHAPHVPRPRARPPPPAAPDRAVELAGAALRDPQLPGLGLFPLVRRGRELLEPGTRACRWVAAPPCHTPHGLRERRGRSGGACPCISSNAAARRAPHATGRLPLAPSGTLRMRPTPRRRRFERDRAWEAGYFRIIADRDHTSPGPYEEQAIGAQAGRGRMAWGAPGCRACRCCGSPHPQGRTAPAAPAASRWWRTMGPARPRPRSPRRPAHLWRRIAGGMIAQRRDQSVRLDFAVLARVLERVARGQLDTTPENQGQRWFWMSREDRCRCVPTNHMGGQGWVSGVLVGGMEADAAAAAAAEAEAEAAPAAVAAGARPPALLPRPGCRCACDRAHWLYTRPVLGAGWCSSKREEEEAWAKRMEETRQRLRRSGDAVAAALKAAVERDHAGGVAR